ncbi:uncharacterized protein LOC105164570 [Sesamum indicum]|uniref:Uncharacterized protein LOC105164570 n=1 Tax=Sesamum indicum TaxID=4182 RepID=A0A6I9TCY7_SESIN|nr:uncharacterized protein LOC105164570 [Sesamum indicum]
MLRGFYIVGCLLSSKLFHPDALLNTLRVTFNSGKGLEFKMIEGDWFLLKFAHMLDHDPVIVRYPWDYDKNLLILVLVDPSDNPSLVDLNFYEFHVHIHSLSLGKMTNDVCLFIGNRLDVVKETNLDLDGVGWGSFVRIRVAIDVNKPLKWALKLQIVLGGEQLITFTYERLPNF